MDRKQKLATRYLKPFNLRYRAPDGNMDVVEDFERHFVETGFQDDPKTELSLVARLLVFEPDCPTAGGFRPSLALQLKETGGKEHRNAHTETSDKKRR